MVGKDDMSAILVPTNIQNMYNAIGEANSEGVFDATYSFVMSGYPVLINYEDMMTQTSSVMPKELVDFQSNSGTTKSTNVTPNISNFDDFIARNKIAQEVVLSNWRIKGVYSELIDFSVTPSNNRDLIYHTQAKDCYVILVQDCKSLGLPLHVLFSNHDAGTKRYKRVL